MMSNITTPHFPFNVIDLTHPISSDSPSWDASCGFLHKITLDYEQCTTTTPFRVQTIQTISKEAALLLLEREIVGLGIDTFSADKADSDYPVHRALLGAGKYLVENIAYAEQLPAVGGYSMALPILTVGGTEAPIRLIGLIPL